MKELHVSKHDAGQRLDRFLAKEVPLLPASLCQKRDCQGRENQTRIF